MASTQPTSAFTQFVVVDASVAIAIAAKEAGSEQKANTAISAYVLQGSKVMAPGVLLSESLYVLCKMRDGGTLKTAEYSQAILDLDIFVGIFEPPLFADFDLALQADAIQRN